MSTDIRPSDCQKSLSNRSKSSLWRAFCDIMNRVMKMLERSANARNEVSFFCIEDLVPKNHLLRKIEKAVDFNEIYPMVEPYYCEDNGRPAVDPVMLVKIVMVWHLFGIRSLRQTLQEIKVNLAYRWFLGLGVDSPVPHFATVSYAFTRRIFQKV